MTKFNGSEILHQKVAHLLRPEELTSINLMRWLKSYNWDVDLCTEVIEEYVKNRKCLGLNDDDFYKDFYDHQQIKHYCDVFQQSRLQYNWINSLDNGIVFVEGCPKSASTTAQLIRTGQFLFAFFAWSEYLLRLILKRERETGQQSFASRVKLAVSYYEELLSTVVIINPPRMLGLLFSIISFLLPKRIIGRFHFVRNAEEASKYISIDAIPEGLGGKMHFDGSFMPNGLNTNGFLKNGQVWEKHNINNIPYEHVFVQSRQSFIHELDTKGKGVLLYEFHATRAFKVKLTNGRIYINVPSSVNQI
uniref:CRAL-TRIO domain-containing protein n=1 Tax=Meloidogyne incognita TaxID=6306 RepID=A0A914KFS8_MELIC